MNDFSESQIEDAKRRVEQMRNRARNLANNEEYIENKHTNKNQSQLTHAMPTQFSLNSAFKSLGIGNNDEESKGSGLILALILVLSYEKSDSMLILALLYILL